MCASILDQVIKEKGLGFMVSSKDMTPIVDKFVSLFSEHLDRNKNGTIEREEFLNLGDWLLNFKDNLVSMGKSAGGFSIDPKKISQFMTQSVCNELWKKLGHEENEAIDANEISSMLYMSVE